MKPADRSDYTSMAYNLPNAHHRRNPYLFALYKRSGARVVYYNQLGDGRIVLLMAYTKAKFDNLPADFLLTLKKEFENA